MGIFIEPAEREERPALPPGVDDARKRCTARSSKKAAASAICCGRSSIKAAELAIRGIISSKKATEPAIIMLTDFTCLPYLLTGAFTHVYPK